MRQPPLNEATGAFKSSLVNPTDLSNSNALVSSATCRSTNLGREQTHLRTGASPARGTTLEIATTVSKHGMPRPTTRTRHRVDGVEAAWSHEDAIAGDRVTFKAHRDAATPAAESAGSFVRMRLDEDGAQVRI